MCVWCELSWLELCKVLCCSTLYHLHPLYLAYFIWLNLHFYWPNNPLHTSQLVPVHRTRYRQIVKHGTYIVCSMYCCVQCICICNVCMHVYGLICWFTQLHNAYMHYMYSIWFDERHDNDSICWLLLPATVVLRFGPLFFFDSGSVCLCMPMCINHI